MPCVGLNEAACWNGSRRCSSPSGLGPGSGPPPLPPPQHPEMRSRAGSLAVTSVAGVAVPAAAARGPARAGWQLGYSRFRPAAGSLMLRHRRPPIQSAARTVLPANVSACPRASEHRQVLPAALPASGDIVAGSTVASASMICGRLGFSKLLAGAGAGAGARAGATSPPGGRPRGETLQVLQGRPPYLGKLRHALHTAAGCSTCCSSKAAGHTSLLGWLAGEWRRCALRAGPQRPRSAQPRPEAGRRQTRWTRLEGATS
jgi:hypothetical protein